MASSLIYARSFPPRLAGGRKGQKGAEGRWDYSLSSWNKNQKTVPAIGTSAEQEKSLTGT